MRGSKIEIDIDKVYEGMLEFGIKPKDVFSGNCVNWEFKLSDVLEDLYGLETELVEKFKQGKENSNG